MDIYILKFYLKVDLNRMIKWVVKRGVDVEGKAGYRDDELNEVSLRLHELYRGKIEAAIKCPIRDIMDLAVWYTPGVAGPCRAIVRDPEMVYKLTNRWNSVAIVSDGSRVLGLGDIGPEAGLPVMEGKALLFKYLGGVDAYPLCLSTKAEGEIVKAVEWIEPSFAGINLEDIEAPKCFRILNVLRERLGIPIWHDDQQGTATVVLGGLLNAVKLVGKDLEGLRIAIIGAGAAGLSICRLLIRAGVDPGNIILVDSRGILNRDRDDLDKPENVEKRRWCLVTNREGREGSIAEALIGMDACIAVSRPGPGVIKEEMIRGMADDPIVFACANPVPEIWPWEAKKGGARIVATGRSDLPNQVNNSLGFPGVFRGTLDVRARTITDEMCIAAAEELAASIPEGKLDEDHILPSMEDWWIYPRVASAVGLKAMEQGLARRILERDQLYGEALTIIERSRRMLEVMAKSQLIRSPP
jgi:malate dehydrogenase (oxaloacetate-decarboxylating)